MPKTYMFNRSNLLKLARLLDMEYKPSELAEEIGVDRLTVYRRYLPAGCPHRRDEHDLIWIHGLSFVAWARAINRREREKGTRHLEVDEAWCLFCRKVVKFTAVETLPIRKHLAIIRGVCAECGRDVHKMQGGLGVNDT